MPCQPKLGKPPATHRKHNGIKERSSTHRYAPFYERGIEPSENSVMLKTTAFLLKTRCFLPLLGVWVVGVNYSFSFRATRKGEEHDPNTPFKTYRSRARIKI